MASKKKDKDRGRNKGKKYDKPVSLHPLSTEEALEALLKTPPKREMKKKEGDRGND